MLQQAERCPSNEKRHVLCQVDSGSRNQRRAAESLCTAFQKPLRCISCCHSETHLCLSIKKKKVLLFKLLFQTTFQSQCFPCFCPPAPKFAICLYPFFLNGNNINDLKITVFQPMLPCGPSDPIKKLQPLEYNLKDIMSPINGIRLGELAVN